MTEVVVLSGSLGSSGAMWDAQLPALERFRVVRAEHPGHGGAPLAEIRDVGDLARFVLDQIDADRFSFVGLSLGGAVGLQLALDVPEQLEKLVVACTSARFGDPQGWRERAETVRTSGLEAVVDAVLERWFTAGFEDVRPYREMFLSTDREGYARCCDALARWDARGELSAIRAQTLSIAGEDDPTAPPGDLERIADAVEGAQFEVIAGARHLANVTHSAEFNRLLLEHLA